MGSWISITGLVITVTVGAIAYGAQQNQVKTNTEDIKEIRKEVREQSDKLREDLTKRINESELRTRSGIRELRQILLQNGNNK